MDNTTLKQSVLDTIKQRRSLRHYRADSVPHDLIATILKAAVWAPSAHNRQPWRFAVIQSDETKEQLASAMGRRLRHELESDDVPQTVINQDVERSYDRITSAPVLIMMCLSMVDMDTYNDAKRNQNEYLMAVQSTAMAGQNALLVAHDLGLAACWMCAPLFCPDVVQDVLELSDDWQPQGMITLGYAAQQREKSRQPLETRVLWR